jgi:hypothetical protein
VVGQHICIGRFALGLYDQTGLVLLTGFFTIVYLCEIAVLSVLLYPKTRVSAKSVSVVFLLHYGLRAESSPVAVTYLRGAGGERLSTGTLSPVVPTNKRKEDKRIRGDLFTFKE